jgi:Family of unknown function (DUF5681)
MEHRRCFVTDEQPSQPLTGRARSLANLKRYPKGQTGNPSGRPKDLANFGDLLMKEFYKAVTAVMNGKTVKKSQGEIVAQQMVKNATQGQASHMTLIV